MPVPYPAEKIANQFIAQTYDAYGRFDGWQLRKITHLPGSPWSQTNERETYGLIPDDLTRTYYRPGKHADHAARGTPQQRRLRDCPDRPAHGLLHAQRHGAHRPGQRDRHVPGHPELAVPPREGREPLNRYG